MRKVYLAILSLMLFASTFAATGVITGNIYQVLASNTEIIIYLKPGWHNLQGTWYTEGSNSAPGDTLDVCYVRVAFQSSTDVISQKHILATALAIQARGGTAQIEWDNSSSHNMYKYLISKD